MRPILFFLILIALLPGRNPTAWAELGNPPRICMVLDRGGKNDRSFNQSAVHGFSLAQKKLFISPSSKISTPNSEQNIPQFLKNFVNKKCDLIIAVGVAPAPHVPAIAAAHPTTKFLAIDVDLSPKDTNNNILSVTYSEHEGSFLAGAIAAMKSQTGVIGFVGGMDIPLIRRFYTGYEAGAKYVNPNIQVLSGYLGHTAEAWANPAKAREMALMQYKQGAQVVFQVAAASGQGVFDAAREINRGLAPEQPRRYAIGVDSNQNWIAPDVILTSIIKTIDHTVYTTIEKFIQGQFQSGHQVYSLKSGGVDWTYDNNNKKFYTSEEVKKINRIKEDIISGQIIVPDSDKIAAKKEKS